MSFRSVPNSDFLVICLSTYYNANFWFSRESKVFLPDRRISQFQLWIWSHSKKCRAHRAKGPNRKASPGGRKWFSSRELIQLTREIVVKFRKGPFIRARSFKIEVLLFVRELLVRELYSPSTSRLYFLILGPSLGWAVILIFFYYYRWNIRHNWKQVACEFECSV